MICESSGAHDDRGELVMRLEEVDGEICLLHDARRPEDVVFALEGPGLLCIGRGLVEQLGPRRLELSESAYGTVFALVE